MSNQDRFLQCKRMKINYNLYNNNPEQAIKQLLGQDIIIESYVKNNIITDDESYIIDVSYYSLRFSPMKIFYINKSDLKQLIPNSNLYVTSINNCNIQISSSLLSEFSKVIPMKINTMIQNNYSIQGQLDQPFTYFGTVVRRPMNYLITPLKYLNHQYSPFEYETIEKIYPENYKHNISITEEATKNEYKTELLQFPILKNVDNVIIVKKFEECVMNTNAYLIDYRLIPKTGINGVIMIQPKRIPHLILYFPTMNFYICEEEIESIYKFLENDEINYINYDYCINVLNK